LAVGSLLSRSSGQEEAKGNGDLRKHIDELEAFCLIGTCFDSRMSWAEERPIVLGEESPIYMSGFLLSC
jgi:hypothetical protein